MNNFNFKSENKTINFKTTGILITGTTEKVFEEKKSLHDVYVDNQNVTVHTPNMKEMKKLNAMDREKFERLNDQRQAMQICVQEQGQNGEIDDDHVFAA